MNKILNLERILCPVAQAHESDEGLRYAILIARTYGARLSVLTCNDGLSPRDETHRGHMVAETLTVNRWAEFV